MSDDELSSGGVGGGRSRRPFVPDRSSLDLGFTMASVEVILAHLADVDASMDCSGLIEHLTEILHGTEEKTARWETTRVALTEFLDRHHSQPAG